MHALKATRRQSGECAEVIFFLQTEAADFGSMNQKASRPTWIVILIVMVISRHRWRHDLSLIPARAVARTPAEALRVPRNRFGLKKEQT